jgi:hypothetical protein
MTERPEEEGVAADLDALAAEEEEEVAGADLDALAAEEEEVAGADLDALGVAEEEAATADLDALAAEEEEAAAAEASRIGGLDPQPDADPAERPVVEAGGGEAEGFELAEEELIRQASHDDAPAEPAGDAFTPEPEADLAGAAYGEGDEVDPTEVTRDPGAGEDDPGEGPGIAADR